MRMRKDMRSGNLRTLVLAKRGSKVKHKKFGGWMNWKSRKGVLYCEIHSRQNKEGQFLKSLIGRLYDRYAKLVNSVNIQFP